MPLSAHSFRFASVAAALLFAAGASAAVGGTGISMPGAPPAPAAGSGAATAADAAAAPRLVLELADGTLLGGAPMEAGPVFDSSLGTVQPAWKDVSELTLDAEPGGDAIRLRTGDRAKGDLRTTLIGVTSALGRARVATTKIRRIQVATGAAAAPEADRGLVLYFPFDSDDGDRVTDRSPAGNDGRMIEAKVTRPGRVGGALSCNGSSGWVRVQPSSSLSPSRLTLAAWIRLNRAITTEHHAIIARQPHGMPGGYNLDFEPDDNGESLLTLKIMTRSASPGYNCCRVREPFRADTWYHVAGTFDGREMRVYVNGQLRSSQRAHVDITYDSTSIHIGSQRDQNPAGFWDGLLDEVRIYDRALDEEEVRRLALVGAPAVPPADAGGAKQLRLEVRLDDHTVVKGTATWTTLPITSATLGKLELPWSLVREVSAGGAQEPARVTLATGDEFRGALGFSKATLDSSLGRVVITPERLRSIRVVGE